MLNGAYSQRSEGNHQFLHSENKDSNFRSKLNLIGILTVICNLLISNSTFSDAKRMASKNLMLKSSQSIKGFSTLKNKEILLYNKRREHTMRKIFMIYS